MTAAQILLAELQAIGHAKAEGFTDYTIVICDDLPKRVTV